MVWAGFGANGRTNLVIIDGRIKSKDYQDMLNTYLIPFGPRIGGQNWKFQQDNASIHVSASTLKWFTDKNINLLDWPSISPDLNPMENLWGVLVRDVYRNGRQYSTVSELKAAILNSWDEIENSVLEKLADSMKNRVFKLIKQNGKTIGY